MCIRALKSAFPHTLPIFAGFWFLGLAYGVYMNVSGFSFLYPSELCIKVTLNAVCPLRGTTISPLGIS